MSPSVFSRIRTPPGFISKDLWYWLWEGQDCPSFDLSTTAMTQAAAERISPADKMGHILFNSLFPYGHCNSNGKAWQHFSPECQRRMKASDS
jgi:hypothetical protein